MIHGYPYKAMSVTGGLHCTFGVAAFATAIYGLANRPYLGVYYGVALFVSLWTLLVGCLGISAGRRVFSHKKIWKLKIAYMVTAILSACFFCGLASWMYLITNIVATKIPILELANHSVDEIVSKIDPKVNAIRLAGAIFTFMEFILAIVSSSICCCCSPKKKSLYAYKKLPHKTPDDDDDELELEESAFQLNG